MSVKGINYKFIDCTEMDILDGIYPVAELDMVGIYLPNDSVVQLMKPDFERLKEQRKAVPV